MRMRRSDDRAALTQEVARFQAEIRRLALAAAREILLQEIDRKRTKRPPARRAAARPGRPKLAPARAKAARATSAAARPSEPAAASVREPATGASPADLGPAGAPAAGPDQAAGSAAHAQAATRTLTVAPGAGRKRVAWTRESIIEELASWISSGTAIDAAFLSRHGPRGLVAAARRIFGRFEAALNVAGLHASKLAPDEEPSES